MEKLDLLPPDRASYNRKLIRYLVSAGRKVMTLSLRHLITSNRFNLFSLGSEGLQLFLEPLIINSWGRS